MHKSLNKEFLRLSDEEQIALISAARDRSPVRGLTHGYYKYPARFSPIFANAAIKTFTKPGDLVLDPHVGGGTTLVEALASGREAIGVDISSLVYRQCEVHRLLRGGAEGTSGLVALRRRGCKHPPPV
jgi:DNA modification methylase